MATAKSPMLNRDPRRAGAGTMKEGEAMTYFGNEGDLDTCCWCGKPAADDERVAIVQFSSHETLWMHLNCESLYSAFCKNESFPKRLFEFVRGEPSRIIPGRVGEAVANIAKELIAMSPSPAERQNLLKLIATIDAVEREHAVANGRVITLSDEGVAKCERWAGERAATRREGRRQ